jgi:hypothetical protein
MTHYSANTLIRRKCLFSSPFPPFSAEGGGGDGTATIRRVIIIKAGRDSALFKYSIPIDKAFQTETSQAKIASEKNSRRDMQRS